MKRFISWLLVICMIVAIVPITALPVFSAEGVNLYLSPSLNWRKDGARFAIYYWNGGTSGWASMSDTDGDGVYKGTIPAGFSNVIFCRMNPASSVNSWSYKWNQTCDLTYNGVNNAYGIISDEWDGDIGAWGMYTDENADEESTEATEAVSTEPRDVVIHYNNTENWNSVYAYLWDTSDSEIYCKWPGTIMEAETLYSGWYSITVHDLKSSYISVIFNNNGEIESENCPLLDIPEEGAEYWFDGQMYTTMPDSYVHVHNWADATCTQPPTCLICGATVGSALGHQWIEATCTSAKTCGACGITEGTVIAHSWVDATCEMPQYCESCGITDGVANGHSWKDATCLLPMTCTVCGDTEGTALGHTWSAATCETSKYCTTCGQTEGAANGHDWVEATCTAPKTCSICGVTEGIASGHSWEDATCTAPKTCSACSETEGEANGHSWQEATCTTAKSCTICGDTEGEILDHSWLVATCTTPNICTFCGVTEGEALGHSGQWIELVEATCTQDGLKALICDLCGTTESQFVPVLGHSNTFVVTAPTCTEQGYTTNTCAVCGEVTITDYVDATGHGWSAWVQIKAPSCTAEGSQMRFCNCGTKEIAAIDKLSHSYVDGACSACGHAMSGHVMLDADTVLSGLGLTGDLYIDLKGFDLSGTITTNGYKVYGMDSTTNEYTCDNMGYFSCVDENGNSIVPESLYTTDDMMRYMTIGTDNGYTFHRFYLGITNISLEPSVTGFGYKARFYGDEVVQAQVETTGYDLWMNENVTVTRTLEGYKSLVTLRLKNFMVKEYGETPVNAKAFIILNDGTRIESEITSYSMRSMIELLNDSYADFTTAQLQNVAVFIKKNPVMEGWNVANILAILQPTATVESITVTDQTMTLMDGTTNTFTLNGAYCFIAQDTEQTIAYSDYADWIADYYITMDAEAGEGLYLAGNYGSYGWIAIPVEAGQTYTNVPVVQTLLGTSLTYTEMVTDVGTFSCGVADTLGNNASATVTVELRLTNPENAEEYITINTTALTLA